MTLTQQFKALSEIVEHYLADKRGITTGAHYQLNELRSSKDFVGGQIRITGATLRYHIQDRRYRVELYKENNGYYQCIEIQELGKKVDTIEVRL
jgi:hypothetical protein